MPLLPVYTDSGIMDGSFLHAMPYCTKNCNDKCASFYLAMQSAEAGFYRCPHGMSVYVYNKDAERYIFTGLRIRGSYDKHAARVTQARDEIYNPVLGTKEIEELAAADIALYREQQNLQHTAVEIKDLVHETRKINGQIKNACDLFWESNGESSAEAQLEVIRNVHFLSYMAYNRFQYFDAWANPTLSFGDPIRAVIYKKFDKMRKLMRGYMRKNVWISLNSGSTFSYNIYPTFETLLFILFENGIKYSPDGNPISVNFIESDNRFLTITISSLGPLCQQNELPRLGTKGFRSENAKLMDKTGQGLGLSFAKKICDMHGINIGFASKFTGRDHGIKYGDFVITLQFEASQK